MRLVSKIDKMPPWLCRLLARKDRGRRPMTNADIALRAGLARSTVCKISQLETWKSIPAGTIDRFSRGCGIDLFSTEAQRKFLKTSRRAYLDQASASQRMMIGKFLRRFAGNHRANAAG